MFSGRPDLREVGVWLVLGASISPGLLASRVFTSAPVRTGLAWARSDRQSVVGGALGPARARLRGQAASPPSPDPQPAEVLDM